MTELFYTWKQPSANGSSLFEKEPIKKIETFLEQARKKHAEHLRDDITRSGDFQNQARQFLDNGGLSQTSLLTYVDKLYHLTRQRQLADPSDKDAVTQLGILTQLKNVLGTQKLPESILPDIKQQLIGFTNKEMERLNEKSQPRDPRFPSNKQPPKGPAAMTTPPPQFNQNQNQQPAVPNLGAGGSPFTPQQFQQMANIMNNYGRNNQAAPQAAPFMNNMPNLGNVNNSNQFDLFQTMQRLGYGGQNPSNSQALPFNGPPKPADAPPPNQNPALSMSLVNSLMSAGLLSGNNKGTGGNPLFADIELTSSFLSKPRPNLIRLLYDELPNACTSCGKRFGNTEEGRKNRTAHMDWHFRVNKKMREESSQMRCWYIPQSDWVTFKDEEDILGLGLNEDEYDSDDYNPESNLLGSSGRGQDRPSSIRSNGNNSGPSVASSKKGGKIDYEALKKKYVFVPTNKHLESLPCPICREKFSSEWADDVEAWVWMNAIEVKNRIFHAICYAETEQSGGELIKRILAQQDIGVGSGNSRGSTPPVAAPVAVKAAPVPNKNSANDALAALGNLDLAAILSTANKRKRDDEGDSQSIKKERTA